MTSLRSYSELQRLPTLKERYHYLALHGVVASATFGFDRYINQRFYTSREWRQLRHHVIARDMGCDLGIEDYEVNGKILIHHMNPMTVEDIVYSDNMILDPEFLISTTLRTHNAIHYGDENLLPKPYIPRRPGDTKLW